MLWSDVMKIKISFFLLIMMLISFGAEARQFPAGVSQVFISDQKGVRKELLVRIAPLVTQSIKEGSYPGAVILAGHKGRIIYQGVFGHQSIEPQRVLMRADTIFDIASLTKVIATAPAIMQLIEQGHLELDSKVAKYWPAFGRAGKENITVRQLLTHTSGLAPGVASLSKSETLRRIEQMKLKSPVGTRFVYSDVNFIVLAHLVELISKEEFNQYVQAHLFKPLQMKDTGYLPSSTLKIRIAPTVFSENKWGVAQDPIATSMGGVAGHAGLFSTAKDLGIFAQALLDGGKCAYGHHILSPLTILKMTTPQTPSEISNVRALGWDMDSLYSNRGVFFPVKSFGHTGWTGTSIWIDPVTQTWIVILTNRVHPSPAKSNQLVQDRRIIANIISASVTDIVVSGENNTGRGELTRSYRF